MHGSPNHRSIKVASPGVGSVDDGVLLLEVRQILATDVYRPAAKITCHLGTQLLEAAITPFPRPAAIFQFIRSRHAPATVQLQSYIKLPQPQRCLIGSRQQTFIFAGKGFLHQLSVVIRLGIRPTVSRGKGETREERIACRTRFDRPGFLAMMEEVEAGRVEAIVIKDMSRLGRDYLKVGQVMEILRQRDVYKRQL